MPQRLPKQALAPTAADIRACRMLLRDGSRTFYAASFLLPRQVREPASALYAFCRLADDSVDLRDGHAIAVADLNERLDKAYRGKSAPHPADRAFAATVERFDIPRELPQALLDGLQWDAEGRRYESIRELEAYAARVAGSVGAMMALLMGVRSPELVARACDLGIAMQLTNIARDVGEDARSGRLYLPARWLREAGIDPDSWLAAPRFSPALGGVISRLLDAAAALYRRADPAIEALPASCRPGMRTARLLYAEIGNEVRRHNCDSLAQRAVVPAWRKLSLVSRAPLPGTRHLPAVRVPCLAEAQFLVDAATAERLAPAAIGPVKWWYFQARALRVIDLFEKLERRERATYHAGSATQSAAGMT